MPVDAHPLLAALFVASTACNGAASLPPTAPLATATAAIEPSISNPPATAQAAPEPPPTPTPPPGPPPYPEEWIREAETTNGASSCRELIYRNHTCSRPRVGSVTVALTLAPDGKVTRVEQVDNTVVNEPEIIWRCLKQKLPKWKLHAPEGVSPALRLTLQFRDKC